MAGIANQTADAMAAIDELHDLTRAAAGAVVESFDTPHHAAVILSVRRIRNSSSGHEGMDPSLRSRLTVRAI